MERRYCRVAAVGGLGEEVVEDGTAILPFGLDEDMIARVILVVSCVYLWVELGILCGGGRVVLCSSGVQYLLRKVRGKKAPSERKDSHCGFPDKSVVSSHTAEKIVSTRSGLQYEIYACLLAWHMGESIVVKEAYNLLSIKRSFTVGSKGLSSVYFKPNGH